MGYRVPNLPLPIAQRSANVCWATVATMMASWRDQATHTVSDYIGGLAGPWAAKLAGDQGLSAAEAPVLLATMGLQVERVPASFSAERWEAMLRDFGPLWVVGDSDGAAGVQSPHAYLLVGVHGPADGDPTVDVIDPAPGAERQMPLSEFANRYGQLAPTPFAGLQIRHWPSDAQRAAQQSLAWAHQAAARLSRAAAGPAAAVIAAAGLGWQVFKELAEGIDDLRWTRARFEGTRIPGDDKDKQHLAKGDYRAPVERILSLQRIQYPDLPRDDNVGAEFEVQYRFNGHCIQGVTITNVSYAPPAPLAGRKIAVDTDIIPAPEHERDDVAALQVQIVYSFSHATGSDGTYVERITIFGDGRTPLRTKERR